MMDILCLFHHFYQPGCRISGIQKNYIFANVFPKKK